MGVSSYWEFRTMSFLTRFLRDEEGATAIEYGLIAALVSVVIIGALTLLGKNLSGTFETIAKSIKSPTPN
jgi:pilus assembly protein Flp/PilA